MAAKKNWIIRYIGTNKYYKRGEMKPVDKEFATPFAKYEVSEYVERSKFIDGTVKVEAVHV